jgi:ferredoxin
VADGSEGDKGCFSHIFLLPPLTFASYWGFLLRLHSALKPEARMLEQVDGANNNMRIVVDLNRCQGYAQCVPLAPDVLKLNGEEALMYDPNPDDSLRQQVLRAAASCPVQAIIVDRLDEKEEKA